MTPVFRIAADGSDITHLARQHDCTAKVADGLPPAHTDRLSTRTRPLPNTQPGRAWRRSTARRRVCGWKCPGDLICSPNG